MVVLNSPSIEADSTAPILPIINIMSNRIFSPKYRGPAICISQGLPYPTDQVYKCAFLLIIGSKRALLGPWKCRSPWNDGGGFGFSISENFWNASNYRLTARVRSLMLKFGYMLKTILQILVGKTCNCQFNLFIFASTL